ncbi:MAG: hypothetical protein K6A37_04390 [Saccharofermentans sp.]|nr:hypothetical protein [Saccharofermentans sp.]
MSSHKPGDVGRQILDILLLPYYLVDYYIVDRLIKPLIYKKKITYDPIVCDLVYYPKKYNFRFYRDGKVTCFDKDNNEFEAYRLEESRVLKLIRILRENKIYTKEYLNPEAPICKFTRHVSGHTIVLYDHSPEVVMKAGGVYGGMSMTKAFYKILEDLILPYYDYDFDKEPVPEGEYECEE